jgi:uncharacterized protein
MRRAGIGLVREDFSCYEGGSFFANRHAVHADPSSPDDKRGPRLGDVWRDWDGRVTPDAAAPKRLFFALVLGFLVVSVGASLLSWYMVTPRLAEWHPAAPAILLTVLAALLLLFALAVGGLTVPLLMSWPQGQRASAISQRVLSMVEQGAFWLGRLLSIDPDRVAHAFIRTNNALIRLAHQRATPDQVLLLLPRCLSKQQLEQARTTARSRGVEVAIVAGGEQARLHIQEKRPSLVIGVACERDLMSGIRDVRRRIAVLGIPNRRPEGPCRDTQIDLSELEAALDFSAGSLSTRAAAAGETAEVTR